jgi:hypothetical protein
MCTLQPKVFTTPFYHTSKKLVKTSRAEAANLLSKIKIILYWQAKNWLQNGSAGQKYVYIKNVLLLA